MADPTKRETCRWAEASNIHVVSVCNYPLPKLPGWVEAAIDSYDVERGTASDEDCDSCPCHEPKEDRDA